MTCPRSAVADRWAGHLGSTLLIGVAVLHVAWAHGASWPAGDRTRLATTVLGIEPDALGDGTEGVPGRRDCYAVAGLLGASAVLVGGRPAVPAPVRRVGLRVVVAVLGARGLLGVTGRTRLAVPAATGAEFVRRDRQLYGPLCLLLAGLASRSLAGRRSATAPR